MRRFKVDLVHIENKEDKKTIEVQARSAVHACSFIEHNNENYIAIGASLIK